MATKKSTKSDTDKPKAKQYKLDLFKETLPALYSCDFDFYDRQPDEAKKEISPLILMRGVSSANGFEEFAPGLVNDFVNINFWTLGKHPELQWKLLCTVASEMSRRTPRHTWMKTTKTKTDTPLLDSYLLKIYPYVNNAELSIVRNKLENEDNVAQMIRNFGCTDSEIKAVVKEYRDIYGSSKKDKG